MQIMGEEPEDTIEIHVKISRDEWAGLVSDIEDVAWHTSTKEFLAYLRTL